MTNAIAFEQFEQPSAVLRSKGCLFADFENPAADSAEMGPGGLPDDALASSVEEIDDDIIAHRNAVLRFDELISDLQVAWSDSLQAAITDVSVRTSHSISALLPSLVSEFGAAQLAASIVAVVEKADLKSPVLMLSPEDHDLVIEELSELASPNRIEVRKSLDQLSGSASLKWDQGGADLDLTGFLTSARHVLERNTPMTSNGEQKT